MQADNGEFGWSCLCYLQVIHRIDVVIAEPADRVLAERGVAQEQALQRNASAHFNELVQHCGACEPTRKRFTQTDLKALVPGELPHLDERTCEASSAISIWQNKQDFHTGRRGRCTDLVVSDVELLEQWQPVQRTA